MVLGYSEILTCLVKFSKESVLSSHSSQLSFVKGRGKGKHLSFCVLIWKIVRVNYFFYERCGPWPHPQSLPDPSAADPMIRLSVSCQPLQPLQLPTMPSTRGTCPTRLLRMLLIPVAAVVIARLEPEKKPIKFRHWNTRNVIFYVASIAHWKQTGHTQIRYELNCVTYKCIKFWQS